MLNDQVILEELSNDAVSHCIVFVLFLALVSKNSIPVFSHRCGSDHLAAASLHYS